MSAERKRRAKCPYCGVTKSLTKDGRFRTHNRRTEDDRNPDSKCSGSGKKAL
jgi:hypothetical protein